MIVHKATGWLSDGRRITAEDWPTQGDAAEALGLAKLYMPPITSAAYLDMRANQIIDHLNIDPARPYGCSIIVEE